MEQQNNEFDRRLRNRIMRGEDTAPEQGDWEHMAYLLDVIDSASPVQKSTITIGLFYAALKWSAVVLLTMLPLTYIDIEYAKRKEPHATVTQEAYSHHLHSEGIIPQQRKPLQDATIRKEKEHLSRVDKLPLPQMRSNESDLRCTKEYQQPLTRSNVEQIQASAQNGIFQRNTAQDRQFQRSYLNDSVTEEPSVDISIQKIHKEPIQDSTDSLKQQQGLVAEVRSKEKEGSQVMITLQDTTTAHLKESTKQRTSTHHWGVLAGAGFAFNMPKPAVQFILEGSYRYDRPSWYVESTVGVEQNMAEQIVSDYTQEYYFLRRETRRIQLEVRSTTYLSMRIFMGYRHNRLRYYAGPVAGYLVQSTSTMSQFNSKGERQVLEQSAKGYIDGLNLLTVGLTAGVEYRLRERASIGARIHYYQRHHAILSNGTLNDFQGYIRYTLK